MSMLKIPVTEADHVQGHATAPITLVEYGDYECPYCGAAHPILKRLQGKLGDELRFVFRNFPIAQSHPQAVAAATTAELASDLGDFWPVHDALYEHQRSLGRPYYDELFASQGLPVDRLHEAIANNEYEGRLLEDFEGGVRSGVNGTPTLFINGQRYDRGIDFDSLMEALQASRR
jgi:protein-disulfide isomerase